MGIFSFLTGRSKEVSLTEKEILLCTSLRYDQDLACALKQITGNEIEPLPKVDEAGELLQTGDRGLCSTIEYKTALDYVYGAKVKYADKRYLLFFFEDNSMNIFLALLKGEEETQIVQWRKTNGLSSGLRNSYIVDTLLEWKQICQYEIIGVGENFIHIKFLQLPVDMPKFSNDVYAFCPAIFESSAGSMEAFADNLSKTKVLQLWWD